MMKKLGIFTYRAFFIFGLIGLSALLSEFFGENAIGLLRLQSDISKSLENTAYNDRFWDGLEKQPRTEFKYPHPDYPSFSLTETVERELTDIDVGIKPDSKISPTTQSGTRLNPSLDTSGLIPIQEGVLIEGRRYRLRPNIDLGKAYPAIERTYRQYRVSYDRQTTVEAIVQNSTWARKTQFFALEACLAMLALGFMIKSLVEGNTVKRIVAQNYASALLVFSLATIADFIFWQFPISKLGKIASLEASSVSVLSLPELGWGAVIAATVASGLLWSLSAFWEKAALTNRPS